MIKQRRYILNGVDVLLTPTLSWPRVWWVRVGGRIDSALTLKRAMRRARAMVGAA